MEYTKLFKRPYSNSIGYTKEEQTAKENHPKLRILAPDNNYPSSYYDKDTGEYNGIYEDIIKKVADNAGFEIEFISYDQSEMSMNGIVMGKADIILTVSGSKQGLTTATLPYTKVSYLPLVKKDTNILRTVKFTSAYWQTIRGLQIILTTNTNNGLSKNIHPLTHF